MKKLLLLLILSFFSAQSFAGSCPDGSEPVKSVSADDIFNDYPSPDLFDINKVRKMWGDAKGYNEAPWGLLAKLFAIGIWVKEIQ